MLAASAYAEHFKFMGIPLDGPLPQFEKALLAKGFTPTSVETNEPNYTWYDGIFAGQNALVGVSITPKSKIVFAVGVSFSELTPSESKDLFERLCKAVERNYPSFKKENDTNDPDAIASYRYFDLNLGSIQVSRFKDNDVVIAYLDVKNTYTNELEMTEDI